MLTLKFLKARQVVKWAAILIGIESNCNKCQFLVSNCKLNQNKQNYESWNGSNELNIYFVSAFITHTTAKHFCKISVYTAYILANSCIKGFSLVFAKAIKSAFLTNRNLLSYLWYVMIKSAFQFRGVTYANRKDVFAETAKQRLKL